MKHLNALLIAALAVLTIGCGGSDSAGPDTPPNTTPDPSEISQEVAGDDIVFVWNETGGCAMAGPNCARYQVTADGAVTSFRINFGEFEEAASGQIDAEVVATWMDVSASTDHADMEARLNPGQLTAAFDGVDIVLEAPIADYVIDSTQYEFDRKEPFFEAAWSMVEAAAAAAPLEIAFR